jgi:predicted nucleotidyltransferase
LSKAELAREIGRNDAVVRRLFTAQVNPELRTVAALAEALGAEIQIVPRPDLRTATPTGTGRSFIYGGRTLAEWVPEIVVRIVQRFDPERIVLFGSLARGDEGRDSDIDLLVIFGAVADKRATAVALRRAIADVPAPVDFVVTDRAEVRERGRIVGPALETALREGKVVYERVG